MNRQTTEAVIRAESWERVMQAMRERRAAILATIEAEEEMDGVRFAALLHELFDLNVALGEAISDGRDGQS